MANDRRMSSAGGCQLVSLSGGHPCVATTPQSCGWLGGARVVLHPTNRFARIWPDRQTSDHCTTLHPSYPTLRNEPLSFAPCYNKFERGCNLDDPTSLRILPSTMSCLLTSWVKKRKLLPQYILDSPRVHPLKPIVHTALCAFFTPLKFPKPSLESLKSPLQQ